MTAFVNIAAPVVFPHPGIRAGTSYYISPMATPGANSNVTIAGTAYYQPFCLPGMGIDRVGLEITTGAGNARLGFYSNLNGTPDQLILDAGILDVSGVAISEISLASTFFLPQSWVWCCAIFSGTPTVRTGTVSSNMWLVGVTAPNSTALRGFTATQAYGALPTQASVASYAATSQVPILLVRKS